MIGTDVFCHILFVMMVIGLARIGGKDHRVVSGWKIYLAANLGWVLVGIKLRLTSVVMWSIVFMVISIINIKSLKDQDKE